jgi:tetratricopeptide (TPR) repeat protein
MSFSTRRWEPDSSHGHKLLGLIQLRLGKAKDAARHLKRVLVSNPEDSDSLYWLSFIYAQAGQMAAARQTCERLSQVDPVFAPFNTDYNLELMDGQFERALKAIKLFLSSYKTSPQGVSLIWEIWTLAINNSLEEAYEKTDKFIEKNSGFKPDMLLFLKYSLQGQKAKALSSATERLREFCQTDEQWSWMLADCYSLVGEKEEAMRWLGIAVNRGFVNYPFISKYDPFLKNIRGEAEFKKLMERVKYEWEHFEE